MLNPRGHRAIPRRKFPTLYPPALPFGLLRRLGLSKGQDMELEGSSGCLPTLPGTGSPDPWRGDIQPSPGPCGGCRIMGWLVLAGHGESWKRKCPWLFKCPCGSFPCYQHSSSGTCKGGTCSGGRCPGLSSGTQEDLHNVPRCGTKPWKGFDSEVQNYFSVRANISLMLLHPRVTILDWLSLTPPWDSAE